MITPVIADNWIKDEAYIFLERNAHPDLNVDTLIVQWKNDETGESGILQMAQPTIQAQYELAQSMYNSLKSGHKLTFFSSQKEWKPLFFDRKDEQNFLITMKDYNALIESGLKETRR